MAEERPRSYLIATSPKAQYEELNLSLAAQVVDARKNLLDTFETMEPPEDDVRLNLTTIGEDFVKVFLRVRPFTPEEIQTNEDKVKKFTRFLRENICLRDRTKNCT